MKGNVFTGMCHYVHEGRCIQDAPHFMYPLDAPPDASPLDAPPDVSLLGAPWIQPPARRQTVNRWSVGRHLPKRICQCCNLNIEIGCTCFWKYFTFIGDVESSAECTKWPRIQYIWWMNFTFVNLFVEDLWKNIEKAIIYVFSCIKICINISA